MLHANDEGVKLLSQEHYNRNSALRRKALKHKLRVYAGKSCMDCGVLTLPDVCYDFDHRNCDEKSSTISALIGVYGGRVMPLAKAFEAIKKEVDKCDLVCANCHRIRTWKNRARVATSQMKRVARRQILQLEKLSNNREQRQIETERLVNTLLS